MLRQGVEKCPLNRGLALEWKKATADLEVPHEIQGDCMVLLALSTAGSMLGRLGLPDPVPWIGGADDSITSS